MKILKMKNKKFHIPTDRIEETERGIQEEAARTRMIDAMTEEELDDYLNEGMREAEEQLKRGKCYTHEEVMTYIEEYSKLLDREKKNYSNWKAILNCKRGEYRVRNII